MSPTASSPFLAAARRRLPTSSSGFLLRSLTQTRHCSGPPSTPLAEAGPLACRLAARGVLRIGGPDAARFLQGLLTNDVLPLAAPSAAAPPAAFVPTPNAAAHTPAPVYAALLTPAGRFLYDFFLYRAPPAEQMLDRTGAGPGGGKRGEEEEQQLLADVDAAVVDEVVACLKKYRLRSRVEIDNVSEEFSCWQRFGKDLSGDASTTQEPEAMSIGWGKAVDCAGQSAAQATDHGWQWFKDPRLNLLGYRGVFPSNSIPPLVEADKETDERHYVLWRLEKGVAEGSTEIPKGEAIPLEYNLAGLNGISFEKGCYIGQELIARTHHRGIIRKRLMPFKLASENSHETEQAVPLGSEIVCESSGKKVGSVNAVLGCRGIGLLRLEEALKQPSDLVVKGKNLKVEVIRPDWWPTEWGLLDESQTAAA